ncbi:MAG TPA: hypothetical protein VLK84_14395 [Longimicrobium sp.]|nr:hypothetical protein [Longimicrobium sp.]
MRSILRGRAAAAALVFLLLGACKGDEVVTPVALAVSPGQLVLTGQNPTGKLYVTTTPVGRLEWRIVDKPEWVTVTPSSGRVDRGPMEVTVTANFGNAEPGTYGGKIEIVSDGGVASVEVRGTVTPNPIATLAPTPVQFAAGVDSLKVTLSNTGRGVMQWTAAGLPSWLTIFPSTGFLQTGQSTQLTARVARRELPGGTTTGSFNIQSNSPAGPLSVPVSVVEPATARAEVSTALLKYPVGINEETFVLRNLGKGPLTWTAEGSAAWMAATPAGGTVPVGGSTTVTATVNRAGLTGAAAGTLTIKSNSTGGDVALSVEVSATQPLSGLTLLSHGVVDAEHSPASGYIAMVATTPANALHVMDPEFATQRSVALAAAPSCVSVEPAGRFAAVCHNGAISYVDLVEMRVVRVYQVSTDALDAVAAGNGYVYVFPRRDQWESIYNIHLATGVETRTGTIYAGMVGRLHPSSQYLYGADNGLSPSDIEKFDLRDGVSQPLYDSPYHGDYEMGGNLWFSETGNRLFAASGNVFRVSETRAEDMRYVGRLNATVRSAAHSTEAARVFTLSSASPAALRVNDDQFYALSGTVPLPQFPLASGTVAAEGRYVFVNRPGTRVFVVARAQGTQQWGVAVLPVSSMP